MALGIVHKASLGVLFAGAVAYLVTSDTGEGVLEYVYVDRVVDDAQSYADRTIKVHGTVVPGTVRQKRGSSGDYAFEIEKDGRRLAVHYTNMLPDTFQDGGEVVVTGKLVAGTFESDEMSAKCPSKYEEELKVAR